MFERYTEKARRVIFFARYEAAKQGSPYIEDEHMLLAIIREDRGLMSRVLPAELSLDQLTADVPLVNPGRSPLSTSVDLPLAASTKRVLALGAEEAERLGDKYIGVGHLLLGLLKLRPERLQALFDEYRITPESVIQAMGNPQSEHRSSASALADVRRQFELLAARLTPEIEPAPIYRP